MTQNRIVGHIDQSLFLDKKEILVGRDARQPFDHSYLRRAPSKSEETTYIKNFFR
jgi:hypothetical protein